MFVDDDDYDDDEVIILMILVQSMVVVKRKNLFIYMSMEEFFRLPPSKSDGYTYL